MPANQQLVFLQQKIQEIGSAIFFNLSDSVLKFPTTIVNTLKVDDYGYVWFFVKRPKQDIKEFEAEFPVRLDFFRKGKNYFLQVMGKAWVVTDPEIINDYAVLPENVPSISVNDMVLVKVKILKAEYQDTQTSAKSSWWQSAMHTVQAWFKSPGAYDQNTYFPAS